jgi:hypothetical protein
VPAPRAWDGLDSGGRRLQHGDMTETIARLRIALLDTDPPIWRRVEVPVEASLKMLHDVIQAAMGWLDYHLWEFEVDGRRYGLPDPDWPDGPAAAAGTKLATLIGRGVRRFDYVYDMGDSWEHEIAIEAVEAGTPGVKYPHYLEGARRAPPEDVGGIPGFEEFLEAIADPGHSGHREATEWHRECYGEAFDPDTIDERAARLRIGQIAKRRSAGRASRAKAGGR